MSRDRQPRHAERVGRLPPYLFVELDRAKMELEARGVDVIDLGIGDPDLPTFPEIVEALKAAAADPATHRYPPQRGTPSLREAIARWFEARYGVALDPGSEVLVLVGTKEGLGHLPAAVLDPGRVALVPDPAYPVYQAASWLAGGEVERLTLEPGLGFLPKLDSVAFDVLLRAQLLFLNYPNNPTAATAGPGFFRSAVEFAERNGLVVVNDAAYMEIVFEGPKESILKVDGARDVGVEFHSFSKTFNMTGWRIGFAAGNAEVLDALAAVKSNLDSGVFTAVQRAAELALSLPEKRIKEQVDAYRRRRDTLVDGLSEAGWAIPRPRATFYVWAPIPTGERSQAFAARLLREAHVVVTPGIGFGPSADGHIRMALTAGDARIAEAIDRIARVL